MLLTAVSAFAIRVKLEPTVSEALSSPYLSISDQTETVLYIDFAPSEYVIIAYDDQNLDKMKLRVWKVISINQGYFEYYKVRKSYLNTYYLYRIDGVIQSITPITEKSYSERKGFNSKIKTAGAKKVEPNKRNEGKLKYFLLKNELVEDCLCVDTVWKKNEKGEWLKPSSYLSNILSPPKLTAKPLGGLSRYRYKEDLNSVIKKYLNSIKLEGVRYSGAEEVFR